MTAAEYLKRLEKDEEYQRTMAQQDDKVRENLTAAAPILEEIRAAGFSVDNLSELRRAGEYPQLVPLLVRWLHAIDNLDVKQDLVRCLSVPWATPHANAALLAEFHRSPQLRWTIGNAMSVVAGKDDLEELVVIADRKEFGKDRQMVVLALGSLGDQRTVPLLLRLLDDEDVALHAVMALGQLRAPQARERLQEIAARGNEPLRSEAKKALAALSPPKALPS